MPQLDLMAFFTQFFWFSLSFIFYYLLLLHYILPFIVLNLKFRKEILKFLEIDINKKKNNTLNNYEVYDNLLYKTLSFFRLYLFILLKFTNSWISVNLIKSNIDFLIQANSKFLKAIVKKDYILCILDNKLKFLFKRSKRRKNSLSA